MAVLLLTGRASLAETLQEVLAVRGIPPDPQAAGDAARPITSYAFHDDARTFLIAYYWDDAGGVLRAPLRLSRYEKGQGQWRHVTVPAAQMKGGEADCLGSVTAIHPTDNAFYLDLHLTPSAGCVLILSKDLSEALEVRAALYGWFLAEFADGTVVYHNSQVHFAPTHAAEISLYQPRSGRSVRIYPQKPYQAVRAAHIEKARAAYSDENWCRERNHHCDPELFDNRLLGIVEINDRTRALAFVARFDNTVSGPDAARRGANAPEFTEVLYVYRNVDNPEQIEFREMVVADFQARFGNIPLSEALEPAILRRIFGD